jgi:AraC-like DNA-binding protein
VIRKSDALSALHRDPAFNRNVDDLAREAGMSRTLSSERMKEALGISPIAYLPQWRMELTREALVDRHLSEAEIAEGWDINHFPHLVEPSRNNLGRGQDKCADAPSRAAHGHRPAYRAINW